MDQEAAVNAFAALAQENRLAVLRLLVKAGPDGLPAGAIAEAVGMQPSKASFHLSHLERSGLVTSRRQSRSIIYAASYGQLSDLIRFLMEDCCAGDVRVLAACATTLQSCGCGPEPKAARGRTTLRSPA